MIRLRPGDGVIAAGVGIVLLGGLVTLAPWYYATRWQATPEAARAERNAVAPTPIWLSPTATPGAVSRVVAVQATSTPIATFVPKLDVEAPPAPSPTSSVSALRLTATSFVFEDPPQPGARARLSVAVHNPTENPSGPIVVALPIGWLSGYRLESTDPPLIDGDQSAGVLRLGFAGPAAQSVLDVSVDFVTTDEVIDAPTVKVLDAVGREIGSAQPPTQAPPPEPGPIYSIDVPRLRLHSGVVPVDWEPPLFVVGQVRTTAYVTLGNSVLVGHLRGAVGYNVFDHLDQLTPGDTVIANSRGRAYDFVVTQTEVLPSDDASPTDPTATPRLTLMTCAGAWDPIARAYPDRLWVIAEPG